MFTNMWPEDALDYRFTNQYSTIKSDLIEKPIMNEDSIEFHYASEIVGADHGVFNDHLRTNKISFSDEKEFKKDVELVLDENLINHIFLGIFYSKEVYSVREIIESFVPPKYEGLINIASLVLTTKVIGKLFPWFDKTFPEGK